MQRMFTLHLDTVAIPNLCQASFFAVLQRLTTVLTISFFRGSEIFREGWEGGKAGKVGKVGKE